MRLHEWRPGTTRWACFASGFYILAVAICLPLAIVQGHDNDWILLGFFIVSGICVVTSAWILARQQARR